MFGGSGSETMLDELLAILTPRLAIDGVSICILFETSEEK